MKMNEIKKMNALSVWQSWSYCIVHNGKNVENRTGYSNIYYRGTIAIHATSPKTKKYLKDALDDCKNIYHVKVDPNELFFGAIIGFAEVVDLITDKDVTRKTKKWYDKGCYGFVLSNVVALKKPVYMPGKMTPIFWELKGRHLKACLDQLSAAQIKKFKEFKSIRD